MPFEAYFHLRWFSLKDWQPLLFYLIVLIALGAMSYFYLPGWITRTVDYGNASIREFQRATWKADDLSSETAFGDQALVATLESTQSEREKDKYRMDRWLRWLDDGIRPTTRKEQVVVTQSIAFDRPYRSINISILSDRRVKLAEGVAFLVSNAGPPSSYRPRYRQMHMTFDQSGDNPPEVKLDSPESGEYLLLILRAVSKHRDDDVNLPSSPDGFNITLRVQ